MTTERLSALVRESDALHERVLAFASRGTAEGFDALALEIAEFQARWSEGHARLRRGALRTPTSAVEIPAVPTDAFRVARVAVHPPELDAVRFLTSGTTTEARGTHAMRRAETYRALSLHWGRAALASAFDGPWVVVALAPEPTEPADSSLGFMMRAFASTFDARPRKRWLLGPTGVDLEGLRDAARDARSSGEPLLVLATSFALVALLDTLAGAALGVPRNTVVMQTGGFKGKSREIAPDVLRATVAGAFGIPEAHVVGEYGMTELTSQLYEGTLPGAVLSGEPWLYLPPPWLRVTAVDPATLSPVPEGEVGLARFVDLGNVDSAVAVVTQDLVRSERGGIRLLGRRHGALPRGCSLAVEALVAG